MHCHISKVKKIAGGRSIYPIGKYLTKEDRFPLANFDWNDVLNNEEPGTPAKKPDWVAYKESGLTQKEVYDVLLMEGFAADSRATG